MLQAELIEEPPLIFGNNQRCVVPRVGLLNFGPNGLFGSGQEEFRTLRAGSIASPGSFSKMEIWLKRLRRRIAGEKVDDSEVRGIDFPGLGKETLSFEIQLDRGSHEEISSSEMNTVLSRPDRSARVAALMELYTDKFADLSAAHPVRDLVLIPLDQEVIDSCKDPNHDVEKIALATRSFDKSAVQSDVQLFDFHHALKVIAFKNGLPCQIIRPATLDFDRSLQHPATIAWNFVVANYYKATGLPWKLADFHSGTCYVGLAFYQETSSGDPKMRTSMAHVYMRTGESQIIRGRPFRWDGPSSKEPSLSEDHAFEVVRSVIDLYERQRKSKPTRLVVHKTSPYREDERTGMERASQGIPLLDLVHIVRNPGVRVFPAKESYPAVRGTMVFDANEAILYTTGYVPALATYEGAGVPRPLLLRAERCDTSMQQIASDIMALTKLDWNTASFCIREPVTTAVSRRVGHILAEMVAKDVEPPEGYRFFM